MTFHSGLKFDLYLEDRIIEEIYHYSDVYCNLDC